MVDSFFRKLQDAIVGHEGEQTDPEGNYENPRYSEGEDAYGDPAYGEFGNVRPASEDPYGDPADYVADAGQFGNVQPASEDPYGDPADEEGF